jgi:predicted alpha/beta superfamily hydrolase
MGCDVEKIAAFGSSYGGLFVFIFPAGQDIP